MRACDGKGGRKIGRIDMEDMILYLEYTISEWSKASVLVLLQVLPLGCCGVVNLGKNHFFGFT